MMAIERVKKAFEKLSKAKNTDLIKFEPGTESMG